MIFRSFSAFLGEVGELLRTRRNCGRYLDQLQQSGLSARSIARRLATLRNFYAFLLREGLIEADPSRAPARPAAMAAQFLSS